MDSTLLHATAASSTAGIITATATAAGALTGLVVAIAGLVPLFRRAKRIEQQTAETARQTTEVHTIVNQQRTDMQRYQAVLVHALSVAGIEVPVDQSIPIAPESNTPPPV